MSKNQDALNDVRRKISEVLNKGDNRLVFGWRGEAEPTRKEGDVWEDSSGKKWTIKNGVRQNVTKLDTAKTPFWCPECSKPLNHRWDMKFWRIRGKCMDCVAKDETKIRREGKYRDYERQVMLRNYIAEVTDKINQLQEFHNSFSKPEYLLMDEHEKRVLLTERWDVDEEKIKSDLLKDIETLKGYLKETIDKYGTGEDDEQQVDGVTDTVKEQTTDVS